MARRFPPTSARTGSVRNKVPSFSRIKWVFLGLFRALCARTVLTRHILNSRDLALNLSRATSAFVSAVCAFFSAAFRISTSSLSLSAYLCSNSFRNLASITALASSRASSNLRLVPLLRLMLDAGLSLHSHGVPPATVCRLGCWFSGSALLNFLSLPCPGPQSGRVSSGFGEAKDGCRLMGDSGAHPPRAPLGSGVVGREFPRKRASPRPGSGRGEGSSEAGRVEIPRPLPPHTAAPRPSPPPANVS